MSNQPTEPISIGSKVNQKVVCINCRKEGTSNDFFVYQDKKREENYFCAECRTKINSDLEKQSEEVNMFSASLAGFVAAVVGAILWYQFTKFSGSEYGVAAIGLGYCIGYAVHFGTWKKFAYKLQILSAVLTAFSIFLAEYLIFSYSLNNYMLANPTDFTGWTGEKVWIDPWNLLFLQSLVSPVGLVIYAIGIYVAFTVCKPRKI